MRVRARPFLVTIFLLNSSAPAWQSPLSLDQQLARIQQQIQSGDLRSARAALNQAVSLGPADPRAWNLLGVVNAQENQFSAAESNFLRAIQSAPRFTGAYLNLGRLYQEHSEQPGSAGKALSTYRKLLDFDPAHIEANYQVSLLLFHARQYAASLQHLGRLPPDARRRAPALALQTADQFGLGHSEAAAPSAQELLRAPDLAEADIVSILPVLLDRHADDLALALLETLAARGPLSPPSLLQLSGLQENRGHFREARVTLQKTLAEHQPTAVLLSRLARLAYRGGDLEGALGYLARARDLEPSNAAIHFFFGMVCVELKLPPEAKKSLQEAVRLDPGNPEYNYALGAVLLNEKNAEGAIPHFQKYRQAHPEDPRGRFALGVAFFDAYQPAAARAEFQAIVARPETRSGAHLYLARLAIREDHLDDAQEHLQKAIQANPSAPEPYAESALVHIRRSEFALAETDLDRALRASPDHYLLNQRLLMLYQRTKDPRAAAQAKRVAELQKIGEEKERLLLRSLEIRPY